MVDGKKLFEKNHAKTCIKMIKGVLLLRDRQRITLLKKQKGEAI